MDQSTTMSKSRLQSQARRGAVGMLWVTVALVFAKGLSFISQIVLGHVLPVETYAVFGLTATAVAMIAGFQNASISKALIQSHDRFEELFPRYSAFAFQFGLLGAAILFGIGALFEQVYTTPELFAVIALTSFSVPFLAINTTLIASLSIHYRFRDINLNDIRRSIVYYSVLVGAALLGADAYSMAIATVTGALVVHLLLLRLTGARPEYFALRPREFIETFATLRWVLLSGFLVALAMRSDFFVVGKLLTMQELGFYTFGFMLVTSLTLPISAGINQVLLPIFAKLQTEPEQLRQEVVHFASAIVILGSALCLLILGLSSVSIHLIWGGKWDGAHLVINVLVAAMPFRFLATISGVGLESIGQWHRRNAILAFEAALLLICALVGGLWAGIEGAILGVVVQRALSGVLGLVLLGHQIGLATDEIAALMTRLLAPFVVAAALLFVVSPTRHGQDAGFAELGIAGVETLALLALFLLLALLLNRPFILTVIDLLHRRLRNRDPLSSTEGKADD